MLAALNQYDVNVTVSLEIVGTVHVCTRSMAVRDLIFSLLSLCT